MDPTLLASGLLVVSLVALALLVRLHVDRVGRLREDLAEARARARELREANGRWRDAWAPLAGGYPHDPRGFRFLGSPVDGVQFEPDRVVLVTFTGPGREADARVRDLVRAGRVEWLEWPLGGPPQAPASPPPAGRPLPTDEPQA